MSDHAKADALVDDILHGKAAGGYGKKHKSGRAAQYATGDEHHSDELGLLEDLGDYLELPPGTFADLIENGNSVLRVIHYPDQEGEVPAGAVRAAQHEDINLITLLITSTASGLQLQRRDGSWMDVNAEPGEIIVDSGDMLARITNGVLPATTHRVVNPPDGGTRRFSLPFFVHPRPEVILRVFDKCQGDGFPRPKPEITADEYLKKRLAAIGLGKI